MWFKDWIIIDKYENHGTYGGSDYHYFMTEMYKTELSDKNQFGYEYEHVFTSDKIICDFDDDNRDVEKLKWHILLNV